MKTIMKNKDSRRSRGFSLIEVTIAIGIVAFAFVALLGMLPVGLRTFTDSIDATVEAQIAQRLFGEAQQIKFSDLSTLADSGRYYDAEGTETGDDLGPPAEGFVYHAVVNSPLTDTLNNPYRLTITVEIAKNRTVQDLRSSAPAQIRRFSFTVADMGI